MVQKTNKNKNLNKSNKTKKNRQTIKKYHSDVSKHLNIPKNIKLTENIRNLPKNLTNKEQDIICAEYINYEPFENKLYKNNKFLSSEKFKLEKLMVDELKKFSTLKNILPENDFYSYINERWLKAAELEPDQKYIVQIDNFRLTQDKVYQELIDIVEYYIQNVKTERSKQLKDYYDSFVKLNTNQQSKDYVDKIMKDIDELRKDKANLWKLLGMINKNEIISWGCPLSWSINPDDKDPKKFRCYITSPQLSLIDLNVYFDDGTDIQYKKIYKNEFYKYADKLFTFAFGKNHSFNVKNILECETKLLIAMGCYGIKEDKTYPDYNRVTIDEAKNIYNLDWKQLSQEIGFKQTPKFFIAPNLNYLKCVTKILLNEWDSDEWRTYWIYIYIRQIYRWNNLHRKELWKFNGEFLRGQESDVFDKLYPVFVLGYAFNTLLTNEYIDKYEDTENVNYVKAMCEDLRSVFTRIIKRNNWLQNTTKKYALDKLHKIKLEVGSPKILREDPVLEYDPEDAWGNLIKISRWRLEQAVELDGKDVIDIPLIDWSQTPPKFISTQAYVVNASYTPSKNGIYIPLGYIQKPFVDLSERGIEYNLAHIGFTLAHEMSHALDDWGSKFDASGKLHDWWSEKDKKKFKEIQRDVIKQYEVFAKRDGIIFDAKPTIGENLADISGFAICLEYLRDFQFRNKDILPIKTISLEAFFIYFAFQMRQKVGKKALIAQLKTNPHPLDKYRTNVPLSRSKVFRALFNVVKGDGMWWHSTNKVWQG